MMEKRVPDWRFGKEKWDCSKMKERFQKIIQKNKKFLVNNVISNSARYGLIKQNEFFEKEIANKENIDGYYVIEKNDFVYNPRKSYSAPYGPICVYGYDEPGVVSPLYLCFRAVKEINVHFYNAYFSSAVWHKYISAHGDMGARHDRVSIQDSVFFDMPISTPPLSEQNKIADYLTCIDNAIIAQEAKLDNIRAMKRGALAKIFSREWRFRDKNGRKFPEWEEKRLGEVCKRFYSGQTPKSTNSSFYNGDIPWLSSGDLNRSIIYKTEKKITEAGRKNANLKIMPVGTFIIAVFGLEADQVCGNCGILGIPSTVNQACMCIFPNEKYLSSKFLFQWYLHMGKIYGNKYCQGTKQQNYNLELLRQLDIVIPCLAEQQKIADYFLRLDKIIEAESTALDAMRKIKRGLLQRLFV